MLKHKTFIGQGIQGRRLDLIVSVTLYCVQPLLVGKNKKEVGGLEAMVPNAQNDFASARRCIKRSGANREIMEISIRPRLNFDGTLQRGTL